MAITFEYGTKYVTDCYGAPNSPLCANQAVWTMLVSGHEDGCFCNNCKLEWEKYVNEVRLNIK